MNKEEKQLMKKAIKQHGKILPIGGRKKFSECFMEDSGGGLCFWFDTPNRSSHVMYNKKPVPTLKPKRVYYSVSMFSRLLDGLR